ncbi:MAG: DUF2914 domain-containing protein [Gammaproteobacteria bacterium]|nr:DUF2914 domain-containing protein [Gammaproteobacteria bacterium]MBQ0773513.1 DUF2914 domain-containing protein [Gammaproteobacteria bacterium]|tara:strand:- start:7167 stop:8141 length:975 start_codon:yes stop_codon:yes gene_type:complete
MPKTPTPRLTALRFIACLFCLLTIRSEATDINSCHGIILSQARFAMAVADRTPIGAAPISIPTDHDAVFFFNDVLHGNGQVLLHRWYYQDELVSEVTLPIGADRWRTWSRKGLGKRRSGNWRIEVATADGCILTRQALSSNTALPVLTQARELLEQNDLIGARLLVKEKLPEYVAYRSRLEGFLNEDLAIAQIKQSIDEDQLYIADARLTPLESNNRLSNDLKSQLPTLRHTLEAQRNKMNTRTALKISAFELVQRRTLAGGTCPANEAALTEKLSILPDSETLLVSGWSITDRNIEAHLIDQRTGFIHRLVIECPAKMISLSR